MKTVLIVLFYIYVIGVALFFMYYLYSLEMVYTKTKEPIEYKKKVKICLKLALAWFKAIPFIFKDDEE